MPEENKHPKTDALWRPVKKAGRVAPELGEFEFADNYRIDEYKLACAMEERISELELKLAECEWELKRLNQ